MRAKFVVPPSADPNLVAALPKRKRGRPRKYSLPNEVMSHESVPLQRNAVAVPVAVSDQRLDVGIDQSSVSNQLPTTNNQQSNSFSTVQQQTYNPPVPVQPTQQVMNENPVQAEVQSEILQSNSPQQSKPISTVQQAQYSNVQSSLVIPAEAGIHPENQPQVSESNPIQQPMNPSSNELINQLTSQHGIASSGDSYPAAESFGGTQSVATLLRNDNQSNSEPLVTQHPMQQLIQPLTANSQPPTTDPRPLTIPIEQPDLSTYQPINQAPVPGAPVPQVNDFQPPHPINPIKQPINLSATQPSEPSIVDPVVIPAEAGIHQENQPQLSQVNPVQQPINQSANQPVYHVVSQPSPQKDGGLSGMTINDVQTNRQPTANHSPPSEFSAFIDPFFATIYSQSDARRRINILETCVEEAMYTQGGTQTIQSVLNTKQIHEKDKKDILMYLSQVQLPRDSSMLKKLLQAMKEEILSRPKVTLTIAFVPTIDQIASYGEWFRTNVHPNILMDIQQDAAVIGGASITWQGKQVTYDLEYLLKQKRAELTAIVDKYVGIKSKEKVI